MLNPNKLPISLRFTFTFAILAFGACGGGGNESEPGDGVEQVDGAKPGEAGAPGEAAAGAGGATGVEAGPDDGTGNKRPTGGSDDPQGEDPGPEGGRAPSSGEAGAGGEEADPKPVPEMPSEEFLRGEALVEKNGCVTCHQQNFAGFTVFPNITPDETTGIGGWTNAQIIAAIVGGVDVDGSTLCSTMMRYPFTDEEANDIVAFLRGIPPVTNRVTSVCPGHGE
jgi:hypothetical protein